MYFSEEKNKIKKKRQKKTNKDKYMLGMDYSMCKIRGRNEGRRLKKQTKTKVHEQEK